jgi:peroxiredoxin
MTSQHGIEFSVLADKELQAIDAFGLRHKGASIDGSDIARPAVFLLDSTGVVKWRFLTDNWRVRVRPQEIIDHL